MSYYAVDVLRVRGLQCHPVCCGVLGQPTEAGAVMERRMATFFSQTVSYRSHLNVYKNIIIYYTFISLSIFRFNMPVDVFDAEQNKMQLLPNRANVPEMSLKYILPIAEIFAVHRNLGTKGGD